MRRAALISLLIAATMLSLTACGKRKRARAVPPVPVRIGDTETGIASWYGHPYHGRRAANGEVYDMDKLTAAHRTMPFETWVRVTNLSNDKSVDVRITDRGPFIDGRIVDLSRAAAVEIGVFLPGTAKVRLEVIHPPRDFVAPARFAIQVGAFAERSRADRIRESLERFGAARLVERPGDPTLWRVLVGEESTLEGAQRLAGEVRAQHPDAVVVRIDQ